MNEPVMASDGFTYDRTSITDWIELNCTSPKTGEKVSSGLIPNYEKKAQIDQWNEKQLKRMRGPCDIEPLVARVAWASSSQEACTELTNLSSIIAQNQLLISSHKLRRIRLCLSSDENVWCPRVAQLLDSLEPPSAAPNNSEEQVHHSEEKVHGGLMALCAVTRPSARSVKTPLDESPPREIPSLSIPVTPINTGLSRVTTQLTPQMHKRKITEVGDGTGGTHKVKAHKTNHQRRPIVKALTAARKRKMRLHTQAVQAVAAGHKAVETLKVHGHVELANLMDEVTKHVELALCGEVGVEELEHALYDSQAVAAHVQTEVRAKIAAQAQARADAEAKAAAQARANAEANAALAKAQAEAKAATDAKAKAEAKAAAEAEAEADASAAVIQAANARLQSFLMANAPKSTARNILHKKQQKNSNSKLSTSTQVMAKRRRLNKYEYLVITAAPPSRLVPHSGAITFVDETKPQQQFWDPQNQAKSSASPSDSVRRQQQHASEQRLHRINNTELCNNTEMWSSPPPNVSNTRHPQQFWSSPSAPHAPPK